MKKMVFMAAFVAATAAFVACSSNDDLVQQKPEVPEEPTVKYPMHVYVNGGNTRGTDLTSTSTFDFSTYSAMPSETTTDWTKGVEFSYNNGSCSTTGALDWYNNTDTYTFYSVSDVANFTKDSQSHPIIPSVTETSVSFGYTMPSATANSEGMDIVEYNDQRDLLVAKTTGSATTTPDVDKYPAGSLVVDFTHALAQIKAIKVYCNSANLKPAEVDKWFFRVNGIKLGGLKRAGTYTFDEATPWVASGDGAEFEIPLNIPTDPEVAFNRMSFVPGAKAQALELPLNTGDGGLYVIPQQVTGDLVFASDVYSVVGAYAELELQGMMDETANSAGYVFHVCENEIGTTWDYESSQENGYQRVRVPISFDITGGSGKGYTLVIDITKAVVIEETYNTNRYEGDLVLMGSLNFEL